MHSFLVDKLQTVCSILALPLKANSCGMFDLAVAWGARINLSQHRRNAPCPNR